MLTFVFRLVCWALTIGVAQSTGCTVEPDSEPAAVTGPVPVTGLARRLFHDDCELEAHSVGDGDCQLEARACPGEGNGLARCAATADGFTLCSCNGDSVELRDAPAANRCTLALAACTGLLPEGSNQCKLLNESWQDQSCSRQSRCHRESTFEDTTITVRHSINQNCGDNEDGA